MKEFFIKRKMLIMCVLIVLICSIAIAIGVYSQVTETKQENFEEDEINYQELENTFSNIFTNSVEIQMTADQSINYDELVYCAYDISESKANYNVNVKIPLFKEVNDVTKQINKEIWDTFVVKVIDVAQNSTTYTTYSMEYVVYVNNNIISLVINCKYKDGATPQRDMIQTYNYDMENEKLLNIENMIDYKLIDKYDVQNKIYEKIKTENNKMQGVSEQGYNVYMRDENSDIYDIDNIKTFFLGKDNYLYLVYAYGNNSYTSVIDLVIF